MVSHQMGWSFSPHISLTLHKGGVWGILMDLYTLEAFASEKISEAVPTPVPSSPLLGLPMTITEAIRIRVPWDMSLDSVFSKFPQAAVCGKHRKSPRMSEKIEENEVRRPWAEAKLEKGPGSLSVSFCKENLAFLAPCFFLFLYWLLERGRDGWMRRPLSALCEGYLHFGVGPSRVRSLGSL